MVLTQSNGNFKLGTYPVNTGHENGVVIPIKFKKPSEEPQVTQDLGAEGRTGMFPNQLFSFSRNINIDTRCSIGLANLPYLLVKSATDYPGLALFCVNESPAPGCQSIQSQFVHLKLHRYGVVTCKTSQAENIFGQPHRLNKAINAQIAQ